VAPHLLVNIVPDDLLTERYSHETYYCSFT
jgi:hypothetical protein